MSKTRQTVQTPSVPAGTTRELVVDGTETVVSGSGRPQVAPVASDGLPVPHKRAVWNQAEVVRFVGVWNESASIQEVVVKMNRSLAACYSMAKQCRKNGIALKSLGRTAGIDWSAVKTGVPASAS